MDIDSLRNSFTILLSATITAKYSKSEADKENMLSKLKDFEENLTKFRQSVGK